MRIQEAQGHSFQKVIEMTETAAACTVPSIPYNVGASVFSLLPRASDRLYMKQELQSTAYPVLAELNNQLSCINLSLLIFDVQRILEATLCEYVKVERTANVRSFKVDRFS